MIVASWPRHGDRRNRPRLRRLGKLTLALAGSLAVVASVAEADDPRISRAPATSPTAFVTASSGGLLAFTRRTAGRDQVFVVRTDGTQRRQLTFALFNHQGVSWSPDGRKLLYAAFEYPQRQIGTSRIVIRDHASKALTTVLSIPDASAGDLFHAFTSPAWSPDASAIAYKNPGFQVSIASAVADATDVQALAQGDDPAWSPLGSPIAFTRMDVGPQAVDGVYIRYRGIWTIRPDGSGLTQLTGGQDLAADWSSDGRRLAFERFHVDRRRVRATSAIYISGQGIARPRRVTAGRSPSWSPDGRQIAFVRDGGIYTIRPGSRAKRILAIRNVTGLDWQPGL